MALSAVVLAAAALAAVVGAQPSFARPELWTHFLASRVNYGASDRVGKQALYRGEPLEVNVFLSGALDRATAVEEDWLARLRVELRSGSFIDGTPRQATPLRCLAPETGMQAHEVGALVIDPGQRVHRPCTLMLDTSGLAPGEYTLALSWGDVDRARFRRPPGEPPHELDFHLLDVTTEAEVLDRQIHLADRATFHGRYDEALQRLSAVLARHPDSVPARIVLADTWLALGDSRTAGVARETAARLAEEGRDALLVAANGTAHGKGVAAILRGQSVLSCGVGR